MQKIISNIYIHIPFCRKKCDYCAFYSETGSTRILRKCFLEKLEHDLAECDFPPDSIDTLYIGGGTPTLPELNELKKLFLLLERYLPLKKDCEISIESNPETLTPEKIDFLSGHINRLSMGIQSFNPNLRKILGRDCSDAAILQALKLIKASSIKNFNLDLIYGIPTQTLPDFQTDLKRAVDCGIRHLSAYNLTIEEQTALAGKNLTVDENAAYEMYCTAGDFMPRYEISNYALNGFECRHNSNVWQGQTLRGFGPAASSFDGIDRFTECSDLTKWLNGASPDYDKISTDARRREIFAVNLRTVNGWTKAQWEKISDFSWENLTAEIRQITSIYPDLINIEPTKINLTSQGLLFWNEIAEDIF